MRSLGYVAAIQLGKLTSQFALGDIYGKRLAIASEDNEITGAIAEIIKSLTGSDIIRIEKKYQDAKPYMPSITLAVVSNKLLRIADSNADEAFINRLAVIPFKRKIPVERQDPELFAKITSNPQELNAILWWVLQGVERLRANNWALTQVVNPEDFIINGNTSADIEGVPELERMFRRFVGDTYVINPRDRNSAIAVRDIFDGFVSYIGRQSELEESETRALHRILKTDFSLEKKRKKFPGADLQVYAYCGLKKIDCHDTEITIDNTQEV